MHRCKTCGTPLDEVPFGQCPEHRAYLDGIPDDGETAILDMDNELLAVLYERTGDD